MNLERDYVKQVFSQLEKGEVDLYLANYVDEHVEWTITGSNVLSGRYTSRQDFVDRAISRLK